MSKRTINSVPVKLFFGLLARDESVLRDVTERLTRYFSPIAHETKPFLFQLSDTYEEEMGQYLLRQWVALEKPVLMGELDGIKIHTNRLEKLWADDSGARQVNIDPGYVSLAKVVLASTKDFSHRIYVGNGIYEEVTLHYQRASDRFEPLPWTYPDYCTAEANDFFMNVRHDLGATQTER